MRAIRSEAPPARRPPKAFLGALALALSWVLAGPAQAQPFAAWLTLSGPASGYLRIADSAALNPTSQITIEAWVNVRDANGSAGCSSIAGKGYRTTWWIGLCGTTFRSYLKGLSSVRNGGIIPVGQWTHVAVTYDGASRKHYINGELVLNVAESGPLPSNDLEMRIGSDFDWAHTPQGAIDELRIWNVARTQAQIREFISQVVPLQPGAVEIWPLDNTNALGVHDATQQGVGTGFLTFPAGPPCSGRTSTTLCLLSRFQVSAKFRVGAPGTVEGTAQTVDCPNNGSGLFQFFGPDNWEIQAKALDGCGLNSRFWFFSAATTNLFYRIEVFDTVSFRSKIYFNYPGPPAPALTDTAAFATCP